MVVRGVDARVKPRLAVSCRTLGHGNGTEWRWDDTVKLGAVDEAVVARISKGLLAASLTREARHPAKGDGTTIERNSPV